MNVVFIRDDQPFASHSRHVIGRNVCSVHVNMSTGRVINGGLFSLRMRSSLTLKLIGVFSFGEILELVLIYGTSLKKMHTDQAAYVFEVMFFGGCANFYVISGGNFNLHTKRYAILDAYVFPYAEVKGDAFV
ncbi:hypothetical protein TNCV_4388061 [Trichonephila clavipes]|nr:hypothetical protein TNCV_4388061 [Trichonephila clavipes]